MRVQLLSLLAAAIYTTAQQQQPLLVSVTSNSTARFIFNSLSTLLSQWGNTYHQNGHTMIPATLAPFTLLYHGLKETTVPPPSPDWFAFDPEMSYAIVVLRPFPTYLLTYQTIRPAKVIYFDGMSAAWGSRGWLDTQEVLTRGHGEPDMSNIINWKDDLGRAKRLCEWASTRDVEGFVRMNAGFEVLWCDFTSPTIQLVNKVNITPPGTPDLPSDYPIPSPRHPGSPPDGPGRGPPNRRPDRGPGNFPNRPPGGPGPPRWGGITAPTALNAADEWIRVATHRSNTPQPNIRLDYSRMVTFYHPRLQSLAAARVELPMRDQRVWRDISKADALSVIEELDEALSRNGAGSGMDWGATARIIVERWSDRIMQLRSLLKVDSETNFTKTVEDIRLLTFTPLNPYMNAITTRNATGWDLFFGPSDPLSLNEPYALSSTPFDLCVLSMTGGLSLHSMTATLTPQETLLRSITEAVLNRLCMDFGNIFAESYDTYAAIQAGETVSLTHMLEEWSSRTESLISWLDWSDWFRCPEVCPWNSACVMPMWPLYLNRGSKGDERTDWHPRCQILSGTIIPWG